jgi:hypothetical protein
MQRTVVIMLTLLIGVASATRVSLGGDSTGN